MPSIHLTDFKFLRMWPRELFKKKDKKGHLLIRHLVPESAWPGVYVLYKGDELYYVGRQSNQCVQTFARSFKQSDR